VILSTFDPAGIDQPQVDRRLSVFLYWSAGVLASAVHGWNGQREKFRIASERTSQLRRALEEIDWRLLELLEDHHQLNQVAL
jgi:hypothetical protein